MGERRPAAGQAAAVRAVARAAWLSAVRRGAQPPGALLLQMLRCLRCVRRAVVPPEDALRGGVCAAADGQGRGASQRRAAKRFACLRYVRCCLWTRAWRVRV